MMETKELMIGDILMAHFNDGESEFDFPVVIDGVDSNCTLVDGTCSLSWTPILKEHYNIEYAEDIKPIPLTEKILKANGFEVCYVSCYQIKFHIWLNDDNDCVEYKISKVNAEYNHLKIYVNGNENISTHLLYVHELQHALRLCGLKDLANNLKID